MTAEQAAQTAAAFLAAFGRDPEGVWAAPGRANIIGEHTDYNDGYVLPIALPHSTCAAISRRDDDVVELISCQHPDEPVRIRLADLGPGRPAGWAGYAAGVLAALRRDGHALGGLSLLVDGRVPIGAGLSSSAALECAVAVGVRDLFSLPHDDVALIDLARAAENDFVGAPTGMLDQSAAMLCTAGHALFLDTRDRSTRQVPLDLAAQGSALLLCDTGTPHALGDGQYGDRRAECSAAAAALGVPALRDVTDVAELAGLDPVLRRRATHVVTEDARVLEVLELMESGADPRAIGPVLSAGHASLRDDFQISTLALDTCVDGALAAGAHGARLVGGGFGGSVIALVEARAVDGVTRDIGSACRSAGLAEPRTFVAVPSEGARRVC